MAHHSFQLGVMKACPRLSGRKSRGGTFFFTVVTYRRRKILTKPESRIILREVISEVRREHPFTVDAWVLLTRSPPLYLDFAGRRWIFKHWIYQIQALGFDQGGIFPKVKPLLHRTAWMTDSKERHRENTIWQRRFWEHQVRDDEDLHRHLDYIHYNPVKHGLVTNPGRLALFHFSPICKTRTLPR